MSERDLVRELQRAIDRADPSWANQPSHLRRRLEEELGSDAPARRAEIHLLVVGAEERLPARLRRGAWTPAERDRLVELLVSTRGWTPAASHWVVATWAAGLGLTGEVPPQLAGDRAPSIPSTSTVGPADAAAVDPTVVPEGAPIDPAPPASLPRAPEPDAELSTSPQASLTTADRSHGAADSDDHAAPATPPAHRREQTTPADLPKRQMAANTKRASQFLGCELDVAYEVKTMASPILLVVLIAVFGVIALLIVQQPILILAYILLLVFGIRAWPHRILAVRDDHVWLLRTRRLSLRPTDTVAEGIRPDIFFAGGWPFPSVRFAGERLWFQFPVTGAARRLPDNEVEDVDDTRFDPAPDPVGPTVLDEPATGPADARGAFSRFSSPVLLTVVAAVAALLGAGTWLMLSGDGSGGPMADADDPLVQAIAVDMAADEGDMILGDPVAAECVARRTVAEFGADRLAQLGITNSNGFSFGDVENLTFETAEVGALYEVLSECVDIEVNFAAGVAANGSVTIDEATCIGRSIGERNFVRLLPGMTIGDQESEESLRQLTFDALDRCVGDTPTDEGGDNDG